MVVATALIVASGGCDDAFLVQPPENPHKWWDGFDSRGFNNHVLVVAEHAGALYAGGYFTRSGETTLNGIARWNGDSWSQLAYGLRRHDCTTETCLASVRALTTWQGQLVAAGRFTIAGGEPALCIAAWDGSLWHGFGAGLHGEVNAVVEYEGLLVAGGEFTATGTGVAVPHLAVWNGSEWLPFGGGTDGVVHALAVIGGDLVVGGAFETAGNVVARRLALWDGGGWSAMAQDSDYGEVLGLLAADNVLMAVGSIDTGPMTSPASVARWTGEAWAHLGDGINSANHLCKVGDRFYASRRIGLLGSAVYRLERDQWVPLSSTLGGQVHSMAGHDGRLFIGGTFQRTGDKVSRFIARWDGDAISKGSLACESGL